MSSQRCTKMNSVCYNCAQNSNPVTTHVYNMSKFYNQNRSIFEWRQLGDSEIYENGQPDKSGMNYLVNLYSFTGVSVNQIASVVGGIKAGLQQ